MSVFSQLQPFFSDRCRPTLEMVREANAEYPPEGVRVMVIHTERSTSFLFYFAWRTRGIRVLVGELPADKVTGLPNDHICLFIGELMTVDDKTASSVGKRANSETRASNVRDLARMEAGTSLYMWTDGKDLFSEV